jgi:Flp pilus assembly protein TadG
MAQALERGALMAVYEDTDDVARIGHADRHPAARLSGALRYGRDSRGVASIEMALIFPVMLIIFIGLVDVSNLCPPTGA